MEEFATEGGEGDEEGAFGRGRRGGGGGGGGGRGGVWWAVRERLREYRVVV